MGAPRNFALFCHVNWLRLRNSSEQADHHWQDQRTRCDHTGTRQPRSVGSGIGWTLRNAINAINALIGHYRKLFHSVADAPFRSTMSAASEGEEKTRPRLRRSPMQVRSLCFKLSLVLFILAT